MTEVNADGVIRTNRPTAQTLQFTRRIQQIEALLPMVDQIVAQANGLEADLQTIATWMSNQTDATTDELANANSALVTIATKLAALDALNRG